jgi:hypothetical protein
LLPDGSLLLITISVRWEGFILSACWFAIDILFGFQTYLNILFKF